MTPPYEPGPLERWNNPRPEDLRAERRRGAQHLAVDTYHHGRRHRMWVELGCFAATALILGLVCLAALYGMGPR